jgi:micrococcal nuclease
MTRQARVLRVIDGDTITVRLTDQRRVTVRLLGIDTPELSTGGSPVECGAWDAKAGLERLLLSRQGGGRLVRLITDPTQDERDTYGRWLAYVERVADDLDAGRRLVRSGWSRAYIYDDDFERLPAYRAAEQAARDAFRGGWSLCAGDFHLPFRPRTRNCAAPYIMYVDRVSCAWARGQIARLKRGGRGPRGWACSSGSRFRTGGYCQRGNRVFGWHPAD